MESYQQPHHHYMRPPPPPPPQMTADPHFPHHHQQPLPPPPPPNSWYPNQFQYHPSPPPQQQQNLNQWGPPPPPQPPPQPYPTHPHQPYPTQPYPPPPPPPPPRPSQQPPLPPPPPYPPHPQQNQDWTNANWGHHSAWEYPAPAHGNEEDWAAKAKAWASARSASENQYPQTQFTAVAPQEEPSYYANQYAQPVESHYQDVQQTSNPTSGYQNYQTQFAPSSRPPMMHQQEPAFINSYAPDTHFSFAAKDGAAGGDMGTAFPHHQASPSSFVHQQEVPSSYSSIPGMEDGSQGQHHGHSLAPADGRSMPMNHAQFAYGNHPPDPMDQPLDFIPKFSHEMDPKMNSSYPDSSGPVRGMDSVSAVSSLQSWTTQVAPGESYPPLNPAFPSAPQHDPSIGLPPLPGQPVSMFGRGPSFQPVPSITTPAGLGTGSSLHPTAAFPADAYGASLISERPKKAAVPNWLREEIIKNKATITTSAPEPYNDESQSNEDEIIVKSATKGDQADSKSMESARSAEEEDGDDDEDYEEAQRTAAINQEIKRVLTEVLLKVTDDLFDEIATKVISEDDLADEAMEKPENHAPALKSSPTRPPVPALKASAKILVPVKAKESEGHASGESSSGTLGAGNVLGLANYASDDDDEIQTSGVSKSDSAAVNGATENGHQNLEAEDRRKTVVTADVNNNIDNSTGAEGEHVPPVSKFRDRKITKDFNSEVEQATSRSSTILGKNDNGVLGDEQSVIKSDTAKSTDNDRKAAFSQSDGAIEKDNVKKSSKDDSQERDSKRRDRHESKRSSSGRENYKEVESDRKREAEKEETRDRRDEKRLKKDKTEDHNISREKSKEQDGKHGEKIRESDSRRSPYHEDKDRKKERERDKKRSGKDDADKRREKTKDEKGDRSRHKSSSDASKHKRRRSSSVGSRGRKNKESAAGPDVSDDETSDDSKRKVHSKRRNLSPSPVRSRRRQVSRSPHSKHSQRRHSPYSSLDDSRGKRSKSRSRSPVRRRK